MGNDPESQSKYETAFNLFRISDPAKLRGGRKFTKGQEIEAFLRWAISTERAGFRIRDEVGVAAVASATKVSRATVAQAIDALVKQGMLRARPKAPYQIISKKPRIDEEVRFAGETISITATLAGQEVGLFDELVPLKSIEEQETVRRFIVTQLGRTPDAARAVHKNSLWKMLADDPSGAAHADHEILVFNRLRVRSTGLKKSEALARPFLYELSFICVEQRVAELLVRQVRALKDESVTSVSVFELLEHGAGIKAFEPGRNRLGVSTIDAPVHLFERVAKLAPSELDTDQFGLETPLLKWNYGIFLPAGSEPLLIVSVSYVDPEELQVVVRTMDLNL